MLEMITETRHTIDRSVSDIRRLCTSVARAQDAIGRSSALIEEHKASRREPPQVFVGATDEMQERRPRLSYDEKLRIARDLVECFRASGIECEPGPVYSTH